eukprot:scaffold324619_cov34-Prasinocladus_malaysianus.AAC.1
MAAIYIAAQDDVKVAEFYRKAQAKERELSRLWGEYENLEERDLLARWDSSSSSRTVTTGGVGSTSYLASSHTVTTGVASSSGQPSQRRAW